MTQSAFPSPGVVLDSGQQQGAYEGMTLRDYFAAMAMQALIAGRCYPIDKQMPIYAYEAADAMLRVRQS